MNVKAFPIFIMFVVLGIYGCSNGNSITSPDSNPTLSKSGESQILAAFDFKWDEKSESLKVEPLRDIQGHFNVTNYIVPNFIFISILGWDSTERILTVLVTIENPTNLDVYDVRGILINLGQKKLVNADDYTKIFDKNTPKKANPFRAYAKDEPDRRLYGRYANPIQYIKDETFEIYFPAEISASFIITAAYPDNAPEPYDITDIQQSGTLFETSGSLDITAEILDWQETTAHHVIIEANPITVTDVNMVKTDATHWEATITNVGTAPDGDYLLWIAAYDTKVSFPLYNNLVVYVNDDITGWSFYDDFTNYPHVWTAHGGNWWGKYNGKMDATGGGQCYEEDTGDPSENFNVSYVSSPPIAIPASDKNLVMTFHHEINVDVPEIYARFAWDMCFVRINGQHVSPTGGPPYEHNHYPWTFDDIFCWTSEYMMTESIFNLGTTYNGTTLEVEFVLDTYDYIDNCKPLHFGWRIDDILLEFEQ